MRILFAGTSEIAVPTLRALAEQFEIGAVLTNTDKPHARSKALVPPAVKTEALRLGLEVVQFDRLGSEARSAVAPFGCDTLLCFAYGRMFGPKFLSLFTGEKLNIHPSLLPLLRGPSPIQGAILSQAGMTGISIQRIAKEMDSGDILASCTLPLDGTETTESLTAKVSTLAAELALSSLRDLERGSASFSPQAGEATYTTLIDSSMGVLDFAQSAKTLHAQIRALVPWPKARTVYAGQSLMITGVHGSLAEAGSDPVPPNVAAGTVVCKQKGKGIGIATGDGLLWVTHLQLEKRKELDYLSFLNGNQGFLSSRLG
ncbi:MAG: methionyl-tRNA formyltransferase [Sphaerochaeta sp.]|uniref:methionyl-tRNA formyltransferase n=1 Tax=Sphaerochaeta sp. TaxID=1972642 RepID=UPI001D2B9BCE|nr:methionyl-tRNA formyltransferase [uncultured Sphaerochaeta sp.]MDD3057911.1 methionyl-tRNA formyltransferase [Sphaerochaeta sp.]MDD3929090.1 methionyl-tRNA formyltransferase [Sphaerochaeta sp.]NCC11791.1 methionyl-tRNA formyltransferase [Spirochaetia bacterium]NCC89069.1 methionyl-tRNA formyltransferase [Spirochaetia bacterium]